MKRGWFGQSKRHSEAAKLGWKRGHLRAGGKRTQFLGHLARKGGKYLKRHAKRAAHETWEDIKGTTMETLDVPALRPVIRGGRRVKRAIEKEYSEFLATEGEIDEHMDRELEGTKYTYVHGHIRKKSA